MALETSYTSQPAGSASFSVGPSQAKDDEYWPLSKLKRCYTDYLFSKREEIDEQIDARRYYHGSQWTLEQIQTMKKRKQPVMTFNRVARKIDGVVGLIEKLRQDPKAYARTPQHEEGADLATAALRYVLDEQEWKAKSPDAAQDGAVDGIGGIELELEKGDKGDPEIGFNLVDVQAFFYDPRSYKPDFTDARYMGIGKWLDDDIAKEMFPKSDLNAFSGDAEMHSPSDREMRWFRADGIQKRVRVVDIWYKHKSGWCWALFSGNAILEQGHSYLKDEKQKDICKFLMFSGNVDQDGDRYGFIRNLKSPQDGINARQSKMQHILASRRLMITQGAVDDVEKVRQEWARPDGVVVTNRPVNEGVKADDQTFDFAGWTKMLELNLAEIENFGPNPALIGQGLESQSGRAIALLQQAGLAELGPYILAYRGWKVRVYRAIWNAIQQHWQAERWIRVTDNQNLAQYIAVNKVTIDPNTGQPTLVNALGSLDVDIILDEGPDHINGMQDVYETLSNVLPSIAPLLNPMQANGVVELLVETSPLPADVKKRWKDTAEQAAQAGPPPDPAVEAAKMKAQVDLEATQAKAATDMKIKEATAAADIQIGRERNTAEIEALFAKTNAEIEASNHKHAQTMELEGQRGAMQCDLEQRKAGVQLDAKREEASIKADSLREPQKADAERVDAISGKFEKGIAELVSSFEQSMKEVAKAMSAPKSVTVGRDKAGRVTGATVG